MNKLTTVYVIKYNRDYKQVLVLFSLYLGVRKIKSYSVKPSVSCVSHSQHSQQIQYCEVRYTTWELIQDHISSEKFENLAC